MKHDRASWGFDDLESTAAGIKSAIRWKLRRHSCVGTFGQAFGRPGEVSRLCY